MDNDGINLNELQAQQQKQEENEKSDAVISTLKPVCGLIDTAQVQKLLGREWDSDEFNVGD